MNLHQFAQYTVLLRCQTIVLTSALLSTVFCATSTLIAQDAKIIDLERDLKIQTHGSGRFTGEVTTDELENVPVVKVQTTEGESEAWLGSVDYEIPAPAAGSYTLIFHGKSEPGECQIEVRVWDFASKPVQVIHPPKGFALGEEWKEYIYEFVIEEDHQGIATVRWGNLARPGKTILLRDISLTKN